MKPFFHRNNPPLSPDFKKFKRTRRSAEAPRSSRPKLSQELKKNFRKEPQLTFNKSKKENNYALKPQLQSCMTAKISLNATKTNSPFKGSLGCSTILEPLTPAKSFKFYYQIGFGAFGRVWKVEERASDKGYALKELLKSSLIEKGNLSAVINERKILTEMQSPFLVNLYRSFQDEIKLYLLMDYLRGADLRYHICYHEHFTQDQIKFIAGCMLLALQYIHNKKVIHKDIKPENMIFEENGYLRLTDFGIAVFRSTTDNASESSGTPVYMAPEILFKRNYSYQSDFYSLGVVIFELAMGKRPYTGKTRNEIREELSNKEICLADFELPKGYSPHLADLINKLLKKNPNERLGKNGVKEIKEHPFFSQMKWRKLECKKVKPPYIPNVVCETQAYLSEIRLFNEMNHQNGPEGMKHDYVMDFDFERRDDQRRPKGLKRMRRGSISKLLA